MADPEQQRYSAEVLADELDAEGPREDASPSTSPAVVVVGSSLDSTPSDDEGMNDGVDLQTDDAGDSSEEMMMGDPDQNIGKRVKVYELRDQAWFDRGTGQCKGVYDRQNDVALLMVEAEDPGDGSQGEEGDGPGGFLKDELLLNTQVSKEDVYSRQQETLIVWTDQGSQQDIALSFQDPNGCDDIWQFIMEVQKHLNNQIGDEPKLPMASSSPPLPGSPTLGPAANTMAPVTRDHWQPPSLANIKEHEMWLRMQAKSAGGRERAVENIIGDDYIKQLIGILNQAEDLESINDLHALCSLMQTILMFNDNGIFEYILQDDIFMGVLGMLEYDPEFPTLKASYRAFFSQFSRFRQVVEIKDETIRNKIHQTSRLLYLKDVVLARMLDDPTFGILNGFVFFNQVDITSYIQSDEVLLHQLFADFRPDAPDPPAPASKKRDLVQFLHQLMIMGKGIQIQNRLPLYRILVERGLLHACEWAFCQREATILHAGAEVLTLAVEHDVNAVRVHVLREEEMSQRTLVVEIVGLLQSTADQGLIQQMTEALKTLLEPGAEAEQAFGRSKELSVVDTFIQYFYDLCAAPLFAPLAELPELKDLGDTGGDGDGGPLALVSDHISLINILVELLSYCVTVHAHRAQYYILSNPLAQKVCSLMYAREKPLRHASLRFIKACLRTNNHFIHRNFAKNGVTKAILDLVQRETDRDTMLSSACLDTLELIRKENMKPIIVDMFEKYDPIMSRLAERPFVRSYIMGLRIRWDQYREPPPLPPPQATEAATKAARKAAEEEDAWFQQSDEEDGGGDAISRVPAKRKRVFQHAPGPTPKRQTTTTSPTAAGGGGAGALGLDYDDASDSEGSTDGSSPKQNRDAAAAAAETEHLADELTDVEQKVRAKRMRTEEEEEETFLLGGKTGDKGAVKEVVAAETPGSSGSGSSGPGTGSSSSTGGSSKEKKIRLSLSGLSKKFGKG